MADDDTTRSESDTAPAEDDLGQAIHLLVAGWRVFGRYTLESKVGRGDMSVVWRAHDELLDEAVALKFVAEILAQDPAAVDDLRQKTARARWLAHPHIIRVNDFMRDNTLATVSMEYVDGATLEQKQMEQPNRVFPPAALGPLILQICQGLDYAHDSTRIVHRGLKPSNILVSPEGVVKITDFGIACSLAETRLRLRKGADRSRRGRARLSPQQLEGSPPSRSDDIYALGAMLHELLAGPLPVPAAEFADYSSGDVPVSMVARRAEAGLMGEPIPPTWERVVAACLAKDPMERPSSGEEIIRLLGLAARPPAKEELFQVPEALRTKDPALEPLSGWITPVLPARNSQSPLVPKRRSLIQFLTREEPELKTPVEQIAPVKASAPAKVDVPEPVAAPVADVILNSAVAALAPRSAELQPLDTLGALSLSKRQADSAATAEFRILEPVVEPIAPVEKPLVPAELLPSFAPVPVATPPLAEVPAPAKADVQEPAVAPVGDVVEPVVEPIDPVEKLLVPAELLPPDAPVPVATPPPAEVPAPAKADVQEPAVAPVADVVEPVVEPIAPVEKPLVPVASLPPDAPIRSVEDMGVAKAFQAESPTKPVRSPENAPRRKKSLLIHYPTPEEAEEEAREIDAESGTEGRKERSWVSRAWSGFFRH